MARAPALLLRLALATGAVGMEYRVADRARARVVAVGRHSISSVLPFLAMSELLCEEPGRVAVK